MKLFSKAISQEISKIIHQETRPTVEKSRLSKMVVLRQEVVEMGRRVQPLLARATLFCGGLVLVGGISGAKWGLSYVQTYVQTELVPQLSQVLSQAIDRPIQLGAVEQVSWSGVRLGRSVLPATATDADQIVVEAIDIRFNPLQAVNSQQIKLTLTLIQPTAYIDQDPSGEWVNLKLEFDEAAQIEIEQIRFQEGTITLAPQPIVLEKEEADPDDQPWDTSDVPTQMTLRRVNGSFSLQEQGQRLVFEMAAQPQERGTLKLKGDMRFDRDQLQLALQTHALQIKSFAPFIPTDVKVEDGRLTAHVSVQIQPDRSPVISGTAELRDLAGWAKGEPNRLSGIGAQFRFQGQEALLSQGQLWFGQIPFQLNGKIHLENGFDLNASVPSVDAAPFMQTLQLEVPFPVEGALKSTDLRITGALDQPLLTGTAQAAKPIRFDQLPIAAVQGSFSLALAEDHLWLHEIRLQPEIGGSISAHVEAWLEEDDAKGVLTIEDIPVNAFTQRYGLQLPDHHLGQFNAEAQLTIVDEKPSLTANWQLTESDYPAQGKLALNEDQLQLRDTVVQIGDGTLTAEGEVKQGQWQATLTAMQVPLNQVMDQVPGQLQGQLRLSGSASDFRPDRIQGSGEIAVQLAQGLLTADLEAAQGQWQALVTGTQIALSQFDAKLSGDLETNVKMGGDLTELNLAGIKAEGTAQLPNGIAFFNHPLTAAFIWNGTKLHLQQATAENISIKGWVTPALEQDRLTGIADLDLAINVEDYDLATLPLAQSALPISGRVSLNGTLTGTPSAPQIYSDMQLDRLAIQDFQFEPLQGQFQSQSDQQLRLDLKGQQDRIAVVLGSDYRPASFAVQLDQAQAEGRLSGNQLKATLRNFALEKLKLDLVNWGPVRGTLAGDFDINVANLAAPTMRAAIDLTQPGIGPLNASPHPGHTSDRLTGNVLYRDGTVAFHNGILRLGNSHYTLAAQANPEAQQWSGQIAVEQGELQDLRSLVSPEDLGLLLQQMAPTVNNVVGDFANVDWENIANVKVNNLVGIEMNGTSGVASNSATAAAAPVHPPADTPLPLPLTLPTLADLTTLEGTFSGVMALQGSAQGMAAHLNLQGQDWKLANYGIRQLTIANAQLNQQTLTLPSLQAQGFTLALTGKPQPLDAQFDFTGQISPEAMAGQLSLTGIALPQLQTLLNLPIQLNGQVHAMATLSGHPTQPNLTGELHLDGVNVREMAIQEAKIGFSYIEQQFHLESWQSIPEAQAADAARSGGGR